MGIPVVTPEEVEGILLADYDFTESPNLAPFIAAATAMVGQAVECAARKRIIIPDVTLGLMVTWLAGHLYGCSDQPYKSRHTLRAGGNFQGRTGLGFDGTKYGQMAMTLDPSGCLTNINKSARARAFWSYIRPSREDEPLVAAPIQIPVRWEEGQHEIADAMGNLLTVDVLMASNQDIPLNSILWEGALSDLPSPPTIPLRIYEMVIRIHAHDIKYRFTRYEFGLRRYKNAVPKIVTP